MFGVCFAFLLCIPQSAISAGPVSVTNLYGEAEAYISQADYFWHTTLVLTNCIAYAGESTSSPRQDLTGHTLQLKIGTTSSNIAYTAYAINATAGTWWASITIPTNWSVPKLQFAINPTNSPIIYQFKLLKTKQPL